MDVLSSQGIESTRLHSIFRLLIALEFLLNTLVDELVERLRLLQSQHLSLFATERLERSWDQISWTVNKS